MLLILFQQCGGHLGHVFEGKEKFLFYRDYLNKGQNYNGLLRLDQMEILTFSKYHFLCTRIDSFNFLLHSNAFASILNKRWTGTHWAAILHKRCRDGILPGFGGARFGKQGG